jgi:hypothetical protein
MRINMRVLEANGYMTTIDDKRGTIEIHPTNDDGGKLFDQIMEISMQRGLSEKRAHLVADEFCGNVQQEAILALCS